MPNTLDQFPLFETLCLENGIIANLSQHQYRYEQTAKACFAKAELIDLASFFAKQRLPMQGLFRLKFAYSATAYQWQIFPYQRRQFKRFVCVNGDHLDYRYKWTNRQALNALFAKRGIADEILIVKNGLITDCSIGNLVFQQGNRYFTPRIPLLAGTQRASLLVKGKLTTADIAPQNLTDFEKIFVINALNPLP